MPQLSIYLWKNLNKPFRKYCKQKQLLKSTVINQLLLDKLSKEGYI